MCTVLLIIVTLSVLCNQLIIKKNIISSTIKAKLIELNLVYLIVKLCSNSSSNNETK